MRFLFALAFAASICVRAHDLCAQSADMQPAMILQGKDSVAARLHYPAKAKAQKKEAAVQFYCEVRTDGETRHRTIIAEDNYGPFRNAVQKALQQGRFSPARVGGKAVPVMLGGTVFFLCGAGQPTIVVSLTTADKNKVAGSNYIQPQMLRTYADLERKVKIWQNLVNIGSAYPVAEVTMDVDATGNQTSRKISFESTKNGGLGAVLLKACEGAKFIPAHSNGKRVAGQVNLPIDYRQVADPDSDFNGHLKPVEE